MLDLSFREAVHRDRLPFHQRKRGFMRNLLLVKLTQQGGSSTSCKCQLPFVSTAWSASPAQGRTTTTTTTTTALRLSASFCLIFVESREGWRCLIYPMRALSPSSFRILALSVLKGVPERIPAPSSRAKPHLGSSTRPYLVLRRDPCGSRLISN